MDPRALAEAMAAELATSVPLTDEEWLATARRLTAATYRDD